MAAFLQPFGRYFEPGPDGHLPPWDEQEFLFTIRSPATPPPPVLLDRCACVLGHAFQAAATGAGVSPACCPCPPPPPPCVPCRVGGVTANLVELYARFVSCVNFRDWFMLHRRRLAVRARGKTVCKGTRRTRPKARNMRCARVVAAAAQHLEPPAALPASLGGGLAGAAASRTSSPGAGDAGAPGSGLSWFGKASKHLDEVQLINLFFSLEHQLREATAEAEAADADEEAVETRNRCVARHCCMLLVAPQAGWRRGQQSRCLRFACLPLQAPAGARDPLPGHWAAGPAAALRERAQPPGAAAGSGAARVQRGGAHGHPAARRHAAVVTGRSWAWRMAFLVLACPSLHGAGSAIRSASAGGRARAAAPAAAIALRPGRLRRA